MPFDPPTLRAMADQLDRDAFELLRQGKPLEAAELGLKARDMRLAASEMERPAKSLRNTKRTSKVKGMTDAQKADRAGAIAKARTSGTRDRLQRAIMASEWRTHNRYARERLSISPGMLTRYKLGDYAVPDRVRDLIRLDFGIDLSRE